MVSRDLCDGEEWRKKGETLAEGAVLYEADDGVVDDTALTLVEQVIKRRLEVARMAWNIPA